MLDATHDPARRSWVDSANVRGADFPIQNLPYGVFSCGERKRHVGVAIGDQILDLTAIEQAGHLSVGERPVFDQGLLNPFMALGQDSWRQVRSALADKLDAGRESHGLDRFLIARSQATMHLPFFVRSFTDFYASREHATNVGSMFRDPERALMPNWLHMPIGYNGRASTVVVSGTDIRRPQGQLKGPDDDAPHFGPTCKLDIELELGAVVGTPTVMGQMLTTSEAYGMIFGYVLLNDWSARDIQVWEYQPLGPFQAKAFATSISPWVVTTEALQPFRHPAPQRSKPLLPYLDETQANNFAIHLEVEMASHDGRPKTICRTNAKHLYYSSAQQLAHHASSGCAMCTGDLLGSGTISGTTRDSLGSLLELTWNGRDPIAIDGSKRCFIEDGDTLVLKGWCAGEYRVGFGECRGTVLPAIDRMT